jgi:hypothetical protein
MHMLGEVAVANTSSGSFADYARHPLGGWAGFRVGWPTGAYGSELARGGCRACGMLRAAQGQRGCSSARVGDRGRGPRGHLDARSTGRLPSLRSTPRGTAHAGADPLCPREGIRPRGRLRPAANLELAGDRVHVVTPLAARTAYGGPTHMKKGDPCTKQIRRAHRELNNLGARMPFKRCSRPPGPRDHRSFASSGPL